MLNWIKNLAGIAVVALLAACGGSNPVSVAQGENLAKIASAQGFTSLVAAAEKAGLTPTLTSGSASLTVFAPSNKAFDDLAKKLAFSDGAAMVAGLDGPTLAKILQYHVLPSRKTAAELSSGGATQPTLYTYGGSATTLALKSSGSVTLTDAVLMESKVTAADVSASSGMIHAIDNVLIPPGLFDIVKMAKLNPVFSVFVEALGKTDLAQSLSGAGPFTVFAPTDTAFTAVLAELRLTKEQMLSLPDLILLLAYHVADGKLLAADLAALTKPALLPTALGVPISIGVDMGITDAANRVTKLVGTDIVGSNGVIHVTDKVLLPFPPT